MPYPFDVPPPDQMASYSAGLAAAEVADDAPCRGWLADRGYDPFDFLWFMMAFAAAKAAQGWIDPINWRGGPCCCGRGCV